MRTTMLLVGILLLATGPGRAQVPEPALEPPDAPVAAFDVALYNAHATRQASTDTAVAALATDVLHAALAEFLPHQMADTLKLRTAARSDSATAVAGSNGCNVVVACARAAAHEVKARWVVLPKISKIAAVWLLTAQLVHVPSGATVLDYTAELTGQEAMVRAGARNLAGRVARAVRAGGVNTDLAPR